MFADHRFQLPNVTLRNFVFGDLLFTVVNRLERHLVAAPPQTVHPDEIDRQFAAQRQLLPAVEKNRILIEEAEPVAM